MISMIYAGRRNKKKYLKLYNFLWWINFISTPSYSANIFFKKKLRHELTRIDLVSMNFVMRFTGPYFDCVSCYLYCIRQDTKGMFLLTWNCKKVMRSKVALILLKCRGKKRKTIWDCFLVQNENGFFFKQCCCYFHLSAWLPTF